MSSLKKSAVDVTGNLRFNEMGTLESKTIDIGGSWPMRRLESPYADDDTILDPAL